VVVAGVERASKRRWIETREEFEMSEERERRQPSKPANGMLDSSSIGRTGENHSEPGAEAATSRIKRTGAVEEKVEDEMGKKVPGVAPG
jgi:hypothetical protein